jgi:hypothetical protein
MISTSDDPRWVGKAKGVMYGYENGHGTAS